MVGEPVPAKGDLQREGNDPDPNEGGSYEPTYDDFAPSKPKPRNALSRFPNASTLRPALVCFALFFVASIPTWTGSRGDGYWVSREAVFQHGEWWRLFSALFVHADFGHLLSNAPLFLIFGWFLRAFFGFAVFPALTLVIGALSNLVTILFYEPQTHLVGASGMLYGMVALWLVLYVHFETAHTVTMRIFRALAVSLLMLFPTTFQVQTSYLAHAAGFALGLGFGLAAAPFVTLRDPRTGLPDEPAEPTDPTDPPPADFPDDMPRRRVLH